ncbi:MAG: hypothetical protein IJE76_06010 [Bacteroidales bacterium]|nr:hypothetical protein [Bacteroidales bacterium]
MSNTLVILGSGFDKDLGLNNSCSDFSRYHLCPVAGNDKWSNFENTLRDKVINWYNNGMSTKEAIELNKLWCEYSKTISWFFTNCSDEFKINKKTCAYKFLECLTENSKIYSFNYTNPYEYIDVKQLNEIIHLHGRHYKDSFYKGMMVISQGNDIILGIDSECIPEDGFDNPYIHALVKKHHNVYKKTDIIKDLSYVENVIFYGFSMGIVDFEYFDTFFSSIINGTSNCKRIFYVTYDEMAYDYFRNNLVNVKVDYETIEKNVSIIPIYTKNGIANDDFIDMLKII